jgi:iron-sulfur cluster assembly protein
MLRRDPYREWAGARLADARLAMSNCLLAVPLAAKTTRRYTGGVELTLTERAAEAVRARAKEADVAGWLLRVAVVAGGCSGLTYDLYFVPEANAQDQLVESRGVRVAVDAASAPMLDGTVIDLADARSFSFANPRASRSCSCGASFEVR